MSVVRNVAAPSCRTVRATIADMSIRSSLCRLSRIRPEAGCCGSEGADVRAAVDVMGGDNAPAAVLKGCFEAASLLSGDDSVLLVGDSKISQSGLDSSGLSSEQKSRYRIVHTTQIIE